MRNKQNRNVEITKHYLIGQNSKIIISTYFQAFHDPIKNENALTEEENESVFVNWNELTMCNMKLLKYVLVILTCYILYVHRATSGSRNWSGGWGKGPVFLQILPMEGRFLEGFP